MLTNVNDIAMLYVFGHVGHVVHRDERCRKQPWPALNVATSGPHCRIWAVAVQHEHAGIFLPPVLGSMNIDSLELSAIFTDFSVR